MAERLATPPQADGEADEWAVSHNPAMRAVLDHIAEELAAEFVRPVKASAVQDLPSRPDQEE
jgi:hypothetical protein